MDEIRKYIRGLLAELHMNTRLAKIPKTLVFRSAGVDDFGRIDKRLSADTVEANKHREIAFNTVDVFIVNMEKKIGHKLDPIMVHNLKKYTRVVWASVWKDVDHIEKDARRVLTNKLQRYYDKRVDKDTLSDEDLLDLV